jgi:hypothetical protein
LTPDIEPFVDLLGDSGVEPGSRLAADPAARCGLTITSMVSRDCYGRVSRVRRLDAFSTKVSNARAAGWDS